MATSADSLIASLLQQPGLIGQAWAQGQQANDQHAQAGVNQQLGQQQVQANQQAFAAAAQQQQQDQQYGQWWQTYAANPTPEMLRQGVAQFPTRWKDIQDQKAALEKPALDSQNLLLGQIWNAASNGKPDLVADYMQRVVDAERAGKLDTSDAERTLAAVKNGDPDALSAVKAFAQVHLAAGDPAFAKTLGIGDRENHVAQFGSGGLFDQRTAQIIREPDAAPGALGMLPSDPLGTAASAGERRHGWTPEGPNPPPVVASKVSGMVKALGFSATTPFPAEASNLDIAKALALSEGGPGSLADRNNNPANLTDPKTGAYRKFPTKDAGLRAAAAQVALNRSRGQNTIDTMVRGLPAASGASATIAPNPAYLRKLYGAPSPGYRWKADGSQEPVPGGPKDTSGAGGGSGLLDDDTKNVLAEQYLSGDPSVFQNLGRGKEGAINIVGLRKAVVALARQRGMNGGQIAAAMQDFKMHQRGLNDFAVGPEGRTAQSLNVAIDHLDTLQNAAQALQNGSIPIFNRVSQTWARATGSAIPNNFEAVRHVVAGEVAKVVAGAGGSALADRQDLADGIASANSPQQLAGYIAEMKQLLGGKLHGLSYQYKSATGRDDFANRLSPRTKTVLGLAGPAAGPPAVGSQAPIRVNSLQQAMALPVGTIFLTPDGRKKVR